MKQPASQAVLLDIAMRWLKLADQATKNENTAPTLRMTGVLILGPKTNFAQPIFDIKPLDCSKPARPISERRAIKGLTAAEFLRVDVMSAERAMLKAAPITGFRNPSHELHELLFDGSGKLAEFPQFKPANNRMGYEVTSHFIPF
jgi:hypothetical protein